jgi:hypothetical protein
VGLVRDTSAEDERLGIRYYRLVIEWFHRQSCARASRNTCFPKIVPAATAQLGIAQKVLGGG